ncbi:MAG: class I tRNA ligase family protein, partial [Rhodospirillaceae bacterium]|nr:class I tRNA ligase family protein [Rhodospirillaceae bacterium]
FWVARMMMMSLHFMDDVPFRTVYIHALVRDAKGQKMSKSKGNVIDPLELMDKYGADALRFTLMSMAAQGRDIKLSEQRVEGYRNFATKLWNAARYCEMNDCHTADPLDPAAVNAPVNRWIVGELAATAATVTRGLEEYRFNEAAGALYQFTWGTFCDWYLEFTKPILAGDDAALVAETKSTTRWVLSHILSLLNPLMPFLTEELWQTLKLGDEVPLMLEEWPDLAEGLADAAAQEELDWVVRLISSARTVRAEMNVPPGHRIAARLHHLAEARRPWAARWEEVICRMARLERLEVAAPGEPVATGQGVAQVLVDEATLALPLADAIDVAAEVARLSKSADKSLKDLEAIDRKLNNPAFTSKAPPEVVEEQQERRAAELARLEQLKAAIGRLAPTA